MVALVQVIHGPNDDIFNLDDGTTVFSIRRNLRDAFNIPRNAVPFINGNRVSSNYALRSDDSLEFIFPWGRKGGGPTPGTVMKIPVRSIWGAEPLMCVENVKKRIKAMGGRAVFGWAIKHQPFMFVKLNHCVWEDQDGKLWDVTPVFESVDGDFATVGWPDETEFERDDSAQFEGKSLPSRYVPTHSSPHVAKACEYLSRADVHLHKGNLQGCRHWTDRANEEMRRAGLPVGWDTPDSLEIGDVLKTMFPVDESDQ